MGRGSGSRRRKQLRLASVAGSTHAMTATPLSEGGCADGGVSASVPTGAGDATSSLFLDMFWNVAGDDDLLRYSNGVSLVTYVAASVRNPAGDGDVLQYALERLCRGLASSAKRARQGFSSTLVLLLRELTEEELPSSTVVDVAIAQIARSGGGSGMNRQEKRDFALGRTCTALILARSNRIQNLNSVHLSELLEEMLARCHVSKSPLRAFCLQAIASIADSITLSQKNDVLLPAVQNAFSGSKNDSAFTLSALNSDTLALALHICMKVDASHEEISKLLIDANDLTHWAWTEFFVSLHRSGKLEDYWFKEIIPRFFNPMKMNFRGTAILSPAASSLTAIGDASVALTFCSNEVLSVCKAILCSHASADTRALTLKGMMGFIEHVTAVKDGETASKLLDRITLCSSKFDVLTQSDACKLLIACLSPAQVANHVNASVSSLDDRLMADSLLAMFRYQGIERDPIWTRPSLKLLLKHVAFSDGTETDESTISHCRERLYGCISAVLPRGFKVNAQLASTLLELNTSWSELCRIETLSPRKRSQGFSNSLAIQAKALKSIGKVLKSSNSTGVDELTAHSIRLSLAILGLLAMVGEEGADELLQELAQCCVSVFEAHKALKKSKKTKSKVNDSVAPIDISAAVSLLVDMLLSILAKSANSLPVEVVRRVFGGIVHCLDKTSIESIAGVLSDVGIELEEEEDDDDDSSDIESDVDAIKGDDDDSSSSGVAFEIEESEIVAPQVIAIEGDHDTDIMIEGNDDLSSDNDCEDRDLILGRDEIDPAELARYDEHLVLMLRLRKEAQQRAADVRVQRMQFKLRVLSLLELLLQRGSSNRYIPDAAILPVLDASLRICTRHSNKLTKNRPSALNDRIESVMNKAIGFAKEIPKDVSVESCSELLAGVLKRARCALSTVPIRHALHYALRVCRVNCLSNDQQSLDWIDREFSDALADFTSRKNSRLSTKVLYEAAQRFPFIVPGLVSSAFHSISSIEGCRSEFVRCECYVLLYELLRIKTIDSNALLNTFKSNKDVIVAALHLALTIELPQIRIRLPIQFIQSMLTACQRMQCIDWLKQEVWNPTLTPLLLDHMSDARFNKCKSILQQSYSIISENTISGSS